MVPVSLEGRKGVQIDVVAQCRLVASLGRGLGSGIPTTIATVLVTAGGPIEFSRQIASTKVKASVFERCAAIHGLHRVVRGAGSTGSVRNIRIGLSVVRVELGKRSQLQITEGLGHVDHRIAPVHVTGPDRHVGVGPICLDVDDPKKRVRSVQRRARATNDLDPLDVLRRYVVGQSRDAAEEQLVDALAVDHHEHGFGRARAPAAHIDSQVVVTLVGVRLEAGHEVEQLLHRSDSQLADVLASEHGDHRRRLGHRFFLLGGRRHLQVQQILQRHAEQIGKLPRFLIGERSARRLGKRRLVGISRRGRARQRGCGLYRVVRRCRHWGWQPRPLGGRVRL